MGDTSDEDKEEQVQLDLKQQKKAKLEMVVKIARVAYKDELTDSWSQLNECLSALKADGGNEAQTAHAVLVSHTIRGTAGLLGWPELGQTAGVVEDLLRERMNKPWLCNTSEYWSKVTTAVSDLKEAVDVALVYIAEEEAAQSEQNESS